MKHRFSEVALFCLLAAFPCSSPAVPRHVYLTWQRDTSTTMTVNYQTMEAPDASAVHFDTQSRKGIVSDYRFHQAHMLPEEIGRRVFPKGLSSCAVPLSMNS